MLWNSSKIEIFCVLYMISELNIRCIFCIIRRFFGVLLSVAYFVLVERKFLAYIQNRKGPNKVGLVGMGQP